MDPRTRRIAVAAVAAVAALLVFLLLVNGDDDGEDGLQRPAANAQAEDGAAEVEIVPESGLVEALAGVGYPIYWVGPQDDVSYEVSRVDEGRTYIRYLPEGEAAGTEIPYLTVGSYAQPDALEAIEELAKKPGSQTAELPGGGFAYSAQGSDSVYAAFPGIDVQIEIYDPHPGRALQMVGSLEPVG